MGASFFVGQKRRKGGRVADGCRWKKVASALIKVLVTGAVVAFIIHRLGWSSIASTLAMAQPHWLMAALTLFLLSGVLGVVQWRLLLANKDVHLSFGRCLSLYFIGMFFNNFMLGTVTGDAVRVTYVRTSAGSVRGGIAATFLDRFAGLLAMACFAIVGSGVLLKRGLVDEGRVATAVIALVATFGLFFMTCAFIVSRRVQRFSFRIIDLLPIPCKNMVRDMLKSIALEVHNRHVVVPVGFLAVGIQAMRIGVHILCAASLGLLTAQNFQYFFVFVPILAILMLVPLPFGVKEGIGGSLFVLAGFSPDAPEVPLVMEFLASLVGIVASLAGGVFFVLSRVRTAPMKEPV
ncbi:MAG: hypothetical protein GF344_13155 [Chitinivibrionales bacterium]|nr:hypothetical protein [Chitinivibrionales bacterium]MBD3357681.1 hypothetical protein [Chitinivibrionales bacterium]